jgi:hypothetical protein
MAIYTGDHSGTRPAVVNGCIVPANATQLSGLQDTAPIYVFSAQVTIPYNDHLVSFRPGQPFHIDAALLAALTAAGASFSQHAPLK